MEDHNLHSDGGNTLPVPPAETLPVPVERKLGLARGLRTQATTWW